jgi:hypothetical protein
MLRELTRDEEAVLEAFRRQTVRGAFSASELAGPDVSVATIEKIQKGDKPLTVAKLRAMYRIARRQDPQAALDLVSDVLGTEELDLVVSLAPKEETVQELLREGAAAAAAVGEVEQVLLEVVACDGENIEKDERLIRAARRAEQRLEEIIISGTSFEHHAQPHLVGVR